MLKLIAKLMFDDGHEEEVSQAFYHEADIQETIDYLIAVHCRSNNVELFPVCVRFYGSNEVVATISADRLVDWIDD